MGADIVLVGLDGADRDLVACLADEGRLPVIARMRERGLWGDVESFVGLGDDAAWSSFATGVGPGRHGRRFYRHYRPGTYDWSNANRADIRGVPFWDTLAARGHRFAVLDVPKAPLGSHIENLVVADWMSHGAHEPPVICHPAEIWHDELSAWLDRDETYWDCHHPGSNDDFASSLFQRAMLRADFAIDVLSRAHWDALVVVFAETHCSGHFLWDEIDRVEDVYVAVDMQLGRLIDAAGPASTVIVCSFLGMGSHHSSARLADAVLEQLEPASPSAELPLTRRGLRALRRRVPQGVRDHTPTRIRRLTEDTRDREFGRRRFWRVPTDLPDTPIRFNVIGREPYGSVAPGAEFDALCDELRGEFLALVEPRSGRRLVRDVVVARDAHPGDAPEDFADLFVIWDHSHRLAAASSPRIGELHVAPDAGRPGEHCAGGWLAATGPGIAQGILDAPASVVDLAPTLAVLVDAPFDGEGSAIPGLVRSASD